MTDFETDLTLTGRSRPGPRKTRATSSAPALRDQERMQARQPGRARQGLLEQRAIEAGAGLARPQRS